MVIVIACGILLVGMYFRKRPVLDMLHIKRNEIVECSICILGQSNVSIDLSGEELREIIDSFDNMSIQFDKVDPHMMMPIDTKKYLLFFRTFEGKSPEVIITSNGYMFINRVKYKIHQGKDHNIFKYLNNAN